MTVVSGLAWGSAAQASILVQGSLFDYSITHRAKNGKTIEETRFVVQVGPEQHFSGASYGYSADFFFTETETDLGDGRYNINISLDTGDFGELFPDYHQDDYGTGIGIGVFDPLDLSQRFKLTSAQLSYIDFTGYKVASASVLDDAPEAKQSPWNGSFPRPRGLLGFTNVFDQAVTKITLDLQGQVVGPAAVPEPATWAMMVAGFGLAGGTMRRRKKANIAAKLA